MIFSLRLVLHLPFETTRGAITKNQKRKKRKRRREKSETPFQALQMSNPQSEQR